VEVLGAERLAELARPAKRQAVEALLDEEAALEGEATAISDVDKLLRLRRDFWRLCNNFVSFREFYGRKDKAIFQVGTLYLDGRSADLCIAVTDPDKHAQLATLARIYLVYCECRRKGSDETMTVAAAFTAGDSDQLRVGRNGVFYDRDGRDWDATVVKIVEHPISLRQAFWSPYKKLIRVVGEQVEKFAAAKIAPPAEPAKPAAEPAKPAAKPAEAPAAAPAPPTPFDAGKFAGVFAAIGLAVGAIGTAVASVVTGFLALKAWQMPLALGGLVLAVSGPSMIIATMKLHQRNLAPVLDAQGWAVNGRARINVPFGTSLTQLARLPEGAERALSDPYAEKPLPWKRWAFLAALLAAGAAAWHYGLIAKLLTRL
jgi:hypothetical protein